MKEHAFRLVYGQDLYKCILNFCITNNIKAGFIGCGVGCLTTANIRDAGGKNIHTINEPLEIVSLIGTVSNNRLHLHISLAKQNLTVIGGHMVEGCLVNTTCEIVIVELEKYEFNKFFDKNTGYNEILIKENISNKK